LLRILTPTEIPLAKPGVAVADEWRRPDNTSGAASPHDVPQSLDPLMDAAELSRIRQASAAIAGDADAVRALWAEHRRWVAGVLLAHKPKWADLDDLLQDVAMAVVRKVHEVRDPAAVRPWLRTVALNAAYLAGRKGQRTARIASLTDGDGSLRFDPVSQASGGLASVAGTSRASSGGEPDNAAIRTEGQRLMELAAELPDGYREPLLLKAIQGLSYREIGRILSLPETTIETRIARGRRMLRELASKEA
jgi:RNA polymerase sigma-70 factor (ECF subfamily)